MRPAIMGFVVIGLMANGPAHARTLRLADINDAKLNETGSKPAQPVLLKAQVLLDRAGFSPGPIDGRTGDNFLNALRSFQKRNGIKESRSLDQATWSKLLGTSGDPAMIEYTIKPVDVKGPFAAEIPASYEKKAELKRLDYTSATEMLAERFHMDEQTLEDLNPAKDFDKDGTVVLVAHVNRPAGKAQVSKIEVDKNGSVVRAFDKAGLLVASYPASIGSEEKPAPSGTLKVTRVARAPTYTYDPKFGFKGVTANEKLRIAPGPNNPVGAVWIGLSEKTYGIHGTAEPSKVGKIASHGCVRMTNWDALALAAMVRRGTVVTFLD
jgi:lipoprotein-anchoring transpeptidase ErfK/SrfK